MTLPLFPLNTVLFPGCKLDLQIFEARYLDMIGRCMKQGEGFGVVCILEGEQVGKAPPVVASIGCEAVIRDFVQQDNGLLGIRVEGGRRFRVQRAQVLPDQLTLAEVEWLDDEPEQPLQDEDADLVALLKQGPVATEVWHKIGQTVRQLHDAGVYHADLNSHNLLLDKEGKVWVIDFDKGAIRSPGNWQQANLERLLRSFNKESQLHTSFHFVPENWQALMAGHAIAAPRCDERR